MKDVEEVTAPGDRSGGHRIVHERQDRRPRRWLPRILKGKKVAPYVRCIIIPATPAMYREAMDRGYFEYFPRRGLHHLAAHVRTLPGRSYGYSRKGGEGGCHHKQELHRQDGPPGERGLPRGTGGCRGKRHQGTDRGPGGGNVSRQI